MINSVFAEAVSGVFLLVILIYERQDKSDFSLKRKLFRACLAVTIFVVLIDIFLPVIFSVSDTSVLLRQLAVMLNLIAVPLLGSVYFLYLIAGIFRERDFKKIHFFLAFLPVMLVGIAVVTTPLTRLVFWIDRAGEFHQGILLGLAYLTFLIYCAGICVIVFLKRKSIHGPVKILFILLPVLGTGIAIAQLRFPNLVVTGSAATCILLVLYLYYQTRQLSLDYLTEVSTRQVFTHVLETRLKHAKKTPFSVVVFSLSDFKRINHKFGQHNGDILLKNISRYLRTLIHSNDIYRFSGDQFAIILSGDTGRESFALVRKIETRLLEPFKIGSEPYRISAAIGVVQYPETASTKEQILIGIECAITTAKRDKARQYCYCTIPMLDKMRRKAEVIEILRDAVANDKFTIVFQPIYSVDSKCYESCESLLRLYDTPLGEIYPGEFIAVAEEVGLITDITFYQLKKLCGHMQTLLDEGIYFESVAVNLSSVMLMRKDLASQLLKIIDDSKIPYEKFHIEITESALIENLEVVQDLIYVMRNRGIIFALDDFGTGFSNLSTVLTLPFSIIKFDKSLIWNAIHNKNSAAIIKHLTWAFREIDVSVLAEGVETLEQRDFVCECGCKLIQGFFYARPMQFDAVFKLFSEQATLPPQEGMLKKIK